MDQLVIAYIGFGRAVLQYHLPYTRHRDDIKIKYVYRRHEDRILDLAIEKEYPELNFTEDIRDIESDPEVNMVVVGSPNETHYNYAMHFLKLGKHVLVEKPFTLSKRDAEEVFALANEKGLVVMPNQNRRYDGDFMTLKKVLSLNVLGDILEIESHYDYYRPNKNKTSKPIYLFGTGIHSLDQMISLNGAPEHVVYDVRSMHNPGKCDDYFDIDLFYGRKKVTVKTSYYVKISSPRYIVHGTMGSLVVPQVGHISEGGQKNAEHFAKLSYFDEKGIEHNEDVPILKSDYGRVYEDFRAAVFDKKPKQISDEQVLEVLSILEKGVETALAWKPNV